MAFSPASFLGFLSRGLVGAGVADDGATQHRARRVSAGEHGVECGVSHELAQGFQVKRVDRFELSLEFLRVDHRRRRRRELRGFLGFAFFRERLGRRRRRSLRDASLDLLRLERPSFFQSLRSRGGEGKGVR